jgi:hypothetical protein
MSNGGNVTESTTGSAHATTGDVLSMNAKMIDIARFFTPGWYPRLPQSTSQTEKFHNILITFFWLVESTGLALYTNIYVAVEWHAD